jgi:arginine decarboxylase
MAEHLHAYNSLWQVRGDSWCRLDEAADRLARPTTTGQLKDKYAGICRELLNQLTPLEHYWGDGPPRATRLPCDVTTTRRLPAARLAIND